MRMFAVSAALVLAAAGAWAGDRTPSPPGAEVYIISPKDGATVSSPFVVQFGLKGMGVAPAGIQYENSGHHHLLIDVDEPLNPSEPIPQDKKHLHYGAGQTEALIELSPGQHTLQLVLGDAKHFPFNPPLVSKKITITIKEPSAAKKMGEATLPRRTERRQCR